jgi:hypothetical protein
MARAARTRADGAARERERVDGAQNVSALQYGLSDEVCPPVKPRINE